MNGSFRTKPWPAASECEPGLRVLEYKVLVLMPQLEPVSIGGIHMADTTKDKEELAQTTGMLVAVSPMAFQFADWPRDANGEFLHKDLIPTPGDLVRFKQYAGGEWRGKDGRNYRIIDDKEVFGIEWPRAPMPSPKPVASSLVQARRPGLVLANGAAS